MHQILCHHISCQQHQLKMQSMHHVFTFTYWTSVQAPVSIQHQLAVQALLKHSDARFDFPRIVHSLVQSLSDHSRVITAAIEALAVVHHLIGDQVQGLLVASGASVSSRLMLAARFASSELPASVSTSTREREASPD